MRARRLRLGEPRARFIIDAWLDGYLEPPCDEAESTGVRDDDYDGPDEPEEPSEEESNGRYI